MKKSIAILLVAFMLIGMLAGSVLFPVLMGKLYSGKIVVITGTGQGIAFLLLTMGSFLQEKVLSIYLLTVVASLLMGISCGILSAVLNVQFMKAVKQEYLARVAAIFNAGACGAIPVTSLLLSVLSMYISVLQIYLISGLLCVILFTIVGIRKVELG